MFLKSAIYLSLLTPLFAADAVPSATGLTVHEWGTFTSVASSDGAPMLWSPLAAPSDLPCFVNRLPLVCVKCGANMVRMETPVLYFYAPQATTVSVKVDLFDGLITEWYPKAARVLPVGQNYGAGGQIDWGNVQISPAAPEDFPNDGSASHYYAARNTDSAPLRASGQQEKLLFYRGVARTGVFLEPTLRSDGKLQLRRTGSDDIALAVLFENQGGKIGYRVVHNLRAAPVAVDLPELTADVTDVHRALGAALTAAGLYPKESAAMIETWRDSWFEEGMRVFYLVPRTAIDRMLPLRITPAPATTARVFVGRVEVLSPHMRQTIETALAANDTAALAKCGRFLDPFLELIQPNISPRVQSFISQARMAAQQAGTNQAAAPCKTEPIAVPTGGPLP